jgi:mono/diheme cytochrome c family protein
VKRTITPKQAQEKLGQIESHRAQLVASRMALDSRLEATQKEIGRRYLSGDRAGIREVSQIRLELDAIESALTLLDDAQKEAGIDVQCARAAYLRDEVEQKRAELERLDRETAALLSKLSALEDVRYTHSILSAQLLPGIWVTHILHGWLRSGNCGPARGVVEFLEEALALWGQRQKIRLVRADSGFFDDQLLSFLEQRRLPYIVVARLTPWIKREAQHVEQWRALDEAYSVGEFRLQLLGWQTERRFVVIREVVREGRDSVGRKLIDVPGYVFRIFVTTHTEAPEEIWREYNLRSDMENRIAELKHDLGADGFCLKQFFATEAAFRAILLLFNLLAEFQRAAQLPRYREPAMVRYDKQQFPARYRDGVFIAFHGSWDRAPYPQGGYNVVFQPLPGDRASRSCEVFADGFAGQDESPASATHRPSGLAVGPDGSLYVSDDIRGRIYRIVYSGGVDTGAAAITPCPSASAPAGQVMETSAKPPEGTHPNAGAAATANPSVPEGATPAMVALGDRIYHGEVGGAACAGCHGGNATGSPLGPNLTSKKWLWSDGSYTGILKTIREGVPNPKEYGSPMPPMGGAQLAPEQLAAVAAYVWALSH